MLCTLPLEIFFKFYFIRTFIDTMTTLEQMNVLTIFIDCSPPALVRLAVVSRKYSAA